MGYREPRREESLQVELVIYAHRAFAITRMKFCNI
jgi:hypothetical protein